MKAGKAFAAGIIGAAVMSVLMWVARIMGMQANLEMILGTMITDPGSSAWMIGFVIHLMMGGIFGLIYGWIFEHLTHRSGWLLGGGIGLVHAVVAGIFMGMVPLIHPRMPSPVVPPGAFMSHLGMMGPVAVFMLHFVFGAIVGGMYGTVVHPRDSIGAVGRTV